MPSSFLVGTCPLLKGIPSPKTPLLSHVLALQTRFCFPPKHSPSTASCASWRVVLRVVFVVLCHDLRDIQYLLSTFSPWCYPYTDPQSPPALAFGPWFLSFFWNASIHTSVPKQKCLFKDRYAWERTIKMTPLFLGTFTVGLLALFPIPPNWWHLSVPSTAHIVLRVFPG